MARKFFLVASGMFLLTAAAYLGPQFAKGQGVAQTEVATLSGTVANGETIPLPTYGDGTVAAESDCKWIVSLGFIAGPILRGMDELHCSAPTRTVSVYACNGSPGCPNVTGATANYLIIATRGASGPTSVGRETWGNIKARYAPNGGTVSKGADTK